MEKLRNRHGLSLFEKKTVNGGLETWMGLHHIHMNINKKHKLHEVRKFYSHVQGRTNAIQIHSPNTISYDDHLTRIRTADEKITTAIFHQPNLSPDNFDRFDISQVDIKTKEKVTQLVEKSPYFAAVPKPFRYEEMESQASLLPPVNI